jgi:hypothetical protein
VNGEQLARQLASNRGVALLLDAMVRTLPDDGAAGDRTPARAISANQIVAWTSQALARAAT